MSLTGVQKVDSYDADSWNWSHQSHTHSQPYAPIFDPSLYTNFAPQPPVPGSVQPRHHSIATSRVINTGTSTPPPPRQQIAGSMVKAQPAFKPTWHGFLDTTKDAMTIVEAALQGRLSHISRRPHDKERAEMLTSGTVLVYEENASGIKRWTDAVHWSPSRVMNNCLIYRQLVRALKPEEKKSSLNPSCGGKRKRKDTSGPSITKTGDNVNNSEDEYDNPAFDGAVAGDITPTDPMGKVYANFAQSLTPDQQRRFCGSLIDSYEFKEGGLMKKTISVKYQGTTHHIISYYSLEDVVAGKLKRPFQDPKLAEVQPRPELLANWKVSLEDEESKDAPLIAGYSHQLQPSHIHHQPVAAVTQAMGAHGMVQTHPQLHLQVPDYWQGGQVNQYSTTQSPQHYTPPPPSASQYVSQQGTQHYPVRQPSPLQYSSQQNATRSYSQAPSPQHYSSQPGPAQQYPSPAASTQQYTPQAQQPSQQYPSDQHVSPVPHYPQQPAASQYPAAHQDQVPQPSQYPIPQAPVYDVHVQSATSAIPHKTESPIPQHDPNRRASAPVTLQSYGQPPYHAPAPQQPHPHSYYVTDHKYTPGHGYSY
ncbi:hypothetical protein K458DRAFT_393206 [Lentithecium fluviatile CBS 122367]|uniref:Camp independent regulatory protein n=1 Tax=Lentithecium fluviatile CBS 122367 TaxID=1168545 RepID=A0A6G1IQ09_9PLEO|nr:hypothetical protein K458DRAFT_393206 [Lentithecium fluviatile CBS 122367]